MKLGVRSVAVRFLLFLLVMSLLCALGIHISQRLSFPFAADTDGSLPSPSEITVILDAGHGGEDGGAVSAHGVCEKDLNLVIAFCLRDVLKEKGIRVVLTREEDTLLYDRNVDYQGRKKRLDLLARQEIAESIPNSIFVSIHMNAFPQTQYRGLQVWYSKNNPSSLALAATIQDTVREQLQPENYRLPKAATSSIFLLHHLHSPAVLIECGFLSNPEEAELLSNTDYQQQLASLLATSIFEYITAEESQASP